MLTVEAEPAGSTASGCTDGKPIALKFQYTGSACSATTNEQDGDVKCAGDPAGAEPVGIRVTKHADKIGLDPSDASIAVDGSVTFSALDKKLNSELQFDIVHAGTTVQRLSIHVSCSKPLAVGDQFGSMLLTDFLPQGGDASVLQTDSDEFDMVVTDREEEGE